MTQNDQKGLAPPAASLPVAVVAAWIGATMQPQHHARATGDVEYK